jgi:hypothetical protein
MGTAQHGYLNKDYGKEESGGKLPSQIIGILPFCPWEATNGNLEPILCYRKKPMKVLFMVGSGK